MSSQREAKNQMHSEVLKSLFPLLLAQQGRHQRLSTQCGRVFALYTSLGFSVSHIWHIHTFQTFFLCCVLSFLESIAIWEEVRAPQPGRARNHFSRAPPTQRCRKGSPPLPFQFPCAQSCFSYIIAAEGLLLRLQMEGSVPYLRLGVVPTL